MAKVSSLHKDQRRAAGSVLPSTRASLVVPVSEGASLELHGTSAHQGIGRRPRLPVHSSSMTTPKEKLAEGAAVKGGGSTSTSSPAGKPTVPALKPLLKAGGAPAGSEDETLVTRVGELLRLLVTSVVGRTNLVLVAVLGLLMALIVFLMYRTASSFTYKSVDAVSSPLRSRLLHEASERVVALLDKYTFLSIVMAKQMLSTHVPNPDAGATWSSFVRKIHELFPPAFSTSEELSMIAYVFESGPFISVNYLSPQEPTGTIPLFSFQNVSYPREAPVPVPFYSAFMNDSADEIILGRTTFPGWDVRLPHNPNPTSMEFNYIPLVPAPFMPPQLMIFSWIVNTSLPLGYLSLFISIKQLSDFMNKLELFGGLMYFTDDLGQVLAISDDTPTQMVSNGTTFSILTAPELNNSLVRTSWAYLHNKYPDGGLARNNITLNEGVELLPKGNKYYVDSISLSFKFKESGAQFSGVG